VLEQLVAAAGFRTRLTVRRAIDFKGEFIFLGIVVAVVIASCISGFETQPSVKLNCFKRYLF